MSSRRKLWKGGNSSRPSQSNTLRNYFISPKASPKVAEKTETAKLETSMEPRKLDLGNEEVAQLSPEKSTEDVSVLADTDEEMDMPTKKRIRRVIFTDDSDSENMDSSPKKAKLDGNKSSALGEQLRPNTPAIPDSDELPGCSGVKTAVVTFPDQKDSGISAKRITFPARFPVVYTPKSKSSKKPTTPTSGGRSARGRANKGKTALSRPMTPRSVGRPPKTQTPKAGTSTEDAKEGEWSHTKLDFLKPEKIKDANGHRPTHLDYDERTLHVPDEFLNKQTPAMRQWWILKGNHMDSVLFFKVGKFYELYHMDATVGVTQLGFSYMKGEFAHSGFPETAYGKMVATLLKKGYKVARVEQTETPEMMQERIKSEQRHTKKKFDKVVNREVCQISTLATVVYGPQFNNPLTPMDSLMYAIVQRPSGVYSLRYGVCFVDVSIGQFYMGDFTDDKHSSRLMALLAHRPPAMIILERNCISKSTVELLRKSSEGVRFEYLKADKQFYTASRTIDLLMCSSYFRDEHNEVKLPATLQKFLLNGTNPHPQYEMALKALGGCLWLLKYSEIDINVFSMGKFEEYIPQDLLDRNPAIKRTTMILDSITVSNLNLLGGLQTLQKTLDFCCTAFGKRLLQQWICRPLADLDQIVQRQKAVTELAAFPVTLKELRQILYKMPDLERQIAKLNIFSNKYHSRNHPDSRAIFYEAKTYTKRKIMVLTSTLSSFEKAMKLVEMFSDYQSTLIIELTQFSPLGKLADVHDTLKYFRESFDHGAAKSLGTIVPTAGSDEDFDNAQLKISGIQEELDDYLDEQKKFFGVQQLVYFGNDKKRYQLEVPDHRTYKATGEYMLETVRKGAKPAKRYSTSVTRDLLSRMIRAETERDNIVGDLNRRVFEKFMSFSKDWTAIVNCLMQLDVLAGFAEFARTSAYAICLPKMLPFSKRPYLNIKNGRHPCMLDMDDYVPNSVELGRTDNSAILILTGPNMGGKSTLMRQVSLTIIMAHIGCHVPAERCTMTLVDRVFTRIGAYDDIIHGQSTFLTEMLETSSILQHATPHSFMLVDELGRGTTTHDGNAIATAYLEFIRERVNCRTIFSTHYHSLIQRFNKAEVGRIPLVKMGHMDCIVDIEDGKERVTFLYELKPGNCPNSYGFNVARLAGMPKVIVDTAVGRALTIHSTAKQRQVVWDLINGKCNKRDLLTAFRNIQL